MFKKQTSLVLVLLCSFLFTIDVLSQENVSSETLDALAKNPVWLKLLHYEKQSNASAVWESAVHSEDFFLSKNGKSDPLAELEQTLHALHLPLHGNPNDHAQCRFRGRFVWLRQQLNLTASDHLPKVDCEDYRHWSLNASAKSVSIVFATGYLSNPASYYGHTLLKLNTDDPKHSSELLDVSVNYGAIVPDNENPFVYIAKGLAGGYEAGFTHIEYYYHTHNYGENQLRDLWEYELNLAEAEVELLLAHAWEVLGKKYTYYFMDKNCAYRMVELLEVLSGINLTTGNEGLFFPQTVVQKVAEVQREGKPLLKSIKYHPSRRSRLNDQYKQLNSHERRIVRLIIKDANVLKEAVFTSLPLNSKYRVIDTLIDYAQTFENENSEKLYVEVLRQRFLLPSGISTQAVNQRIAPHTGRAPSRTQMAVINNSHLGQGISFGLRPAYYDELDSGDSHVRYAALSMAALDIVFINDQLRLRELDLVEITNVNELATGLPDDRAWAWRLKAGIENQDLACSSGCSVAYASGDKGYSVSPFSQSLLTGYVGAAIQDNRNKSGNFFWRASVSWAWDVSENLRVLLETEHRQYVDSEQSTDRFKLTSRYNWGKNSDLRLSYEKNDAEEFSLSFGYYW